MRPTVFFAILSAMEVLQSFISMVAQPFHEVLKVFFYEGPTLGKIFRRVREGQETVLIVLLSLMDAANRPLARPFEPAPDTTATRDSHRIRPPMVRFAPRPTGDLPPVQRVVARH